MIDSCKNEKHIDIAEFLMSLPLFKDLERGEIDKLVDKNMIYVKKYRSGESVYGSDISSDRIHPAIIMKGNATVFSSDDDRDVCLRLLGVGEMFGVVNMFANDERFISSVIVERSATVVFISPTAFKHLLESNVQFMYSYLKLLSNRVSFLNRKIRQFTAGSAERRLAVYIETVSENDSFDLPYSYSKLSEMLDIGRASLYRAIDNLTDKGIITRDGKHITIIDRQALRKFGCRSEK